MDAEQLIVRNLKAPVLEVANDGDLLALAENKPGGGIVIMSPRASDAIVRSIVTLLENETGHLQKREIVFAAYIKGRAQRARKFNDEHSPAT